MAYRFGIPDDVAEWFGDRGDEVEHQDDQDDEGAQKPPGHLPEDVWLVTNHELNVLIESVKGKSESERTVRSSIPCLHAILPVPPPGR